MRIQDIDEIKITLNGREVLKTEGKGLGGEAQMKTLAQTFGKAARKVILAVFKKLDNAEKHWNSTRGYTQAQIDWARLNNKLLFRSYSAKVEQVGGVSMSFTKIYSRHIAPQNN